MSRGSGQVRVLRPHLCPSAEVPGLHPDLRAEQVIAADVSRERRAVFEQFGVRANSEVAEAVRGARAILLSVKPQQMADVLAGHRSAAAAVEELMLRPQKTEVT